MRLLAFRSNDKKHAKVVCQDKEKAHKQTGLCNKYHLTHDGTDTYYEERVEVEMLKY